MRILPYTSVRGPAHRAPLAVAVALLTQVTFIAIGGSQEPGGVETPAGLSEELPKDRATVTTLTGKVMATRGSLFFDAPSQTLRLGTQSVPFKGVLSIAFSPETLLDPGVPIAMLTSGEELRMRLQTGSEDEIVFTCDVLGGEPTRRLAIDQVRALAFPDRFRSGIELLRFRQSFASASRAPIVPERGDSRSSLPPPPIAATASAEGRDPDKDHVLTAEGSWLSGLLTLVGGDSVSFEADDIGAVEISFERLRAVIIAVGPETVDPGDGHAGSDAGPSGPAVALRGIDGSALEGSLVSIRDDTLRLRSHGLGDVILPLSRVSRLDVRGGKVRYLSDLNPKRATSKDLFSPRPVQRDANVRGGPLTLRGTVHRKGLGMRSHTRLEFDLDEDHGRFQSIVGIDDDARLTTVRAHLSGAATAIFRVYLDDAVIYEKELSRRDAPEVIDIPLKGKKRLALEVDYGPGLWMQDFADWADAKFILK